MQKHLFYVLLAHVSIVNATKQPNIVFVIVDDLGWTDVGYHGGNIPTPNMDSLAASGVKLDNYYVTPVCSPTRSAMLTGQYPYRLGLQHLVIIAGSTQHIPMNVPTMAEELKKVGYVNRALGKWHVGYSKFEYTPTGRGFDSHIGYYQAMEDYYTKHMCLSQPVNGTFCGLDFWYNRTSVGTNKNYSTDIYRNEAVDIINTHDVEKPLFLYFALQALHLPLMLPPEPKYADQCKTIQDPYRREYCAIGVAADDAIGTIVSTLKTKGMWDNTILVVTTDNGGMVTIPGNDFKSAGCNYPYRAGKATIFEGGVKGLGFVTSPLIPKAAQGRAINNMMHVVDWMPTLFSQTNATVPEGIDGIDLWPAITGQNTSVGHTELILNMDAHALPPTDWIDKLDRDIQLFLDKLFGHHNAMPPPTNAIRVGDWKLVYGQPFYDGWYMQNGTIIPPPKGSNKTTTWLFNIANDPYEHHNLADSNPGKVIELRDRMRYYHKKNYREPQYFIPDPLGFPEFHHGVWAPFQK